jgi:hypothetical protein
MPGRPFDPAGLEILPFEACLRLLRPSPQGRGEQGGKR